MCATLGIRHAFSQAYHHRANGRVERAGQEILERLRKLSASHQVNWVEVLPQVVDRYHDTPGESGYSPYEILFGRSRPLADRPYAPPTVCEDAVNFFTRMRKLDLKVSRVMEERHRAIEDRQGATNPKEFVLGQRVWYRRPEGAGEKLDTRWLGPALVTAREGEHSWLIEIKPGVHIKAHQSFLKPFWEDTVYGDPIPLFYHQRTVVDPEAQPDEWVVEKILRHRIGPDGNLEFYTHWRGYSEEDSSWEPVRHFIHRYATDLVKYCREHNLRVDLTRYLRDSPME